MANAFTQIYLQIIFAVKGRENLIKREFQDEINKYIAGIIKAKNQKPIIVNGVSDHIHIFIGFKPSYLLTDLIRDIKNNTTNFINEKKFAEKKFSWQDGYGAFSYSNWDVNKIFQYILNQEEHHKTINFKNEFIGFLDESHIDYNKDYLFDWVE